MFETGMSALVLKICSEYAKSLGLNFPPCTQQEINAICEWVDKHTIKDMTISQDGYNVTFTFKTENDTTKEFTFTIPKIIDVEELAKVLVGSESVVVERLENNSGLRVRLAQSVLDNINSKLTKPSNPTSDSVITMAANGTVGTKPLSEIGGDGGKLYLHVIKMTTGSYGQNVLNTGTGSNIDGNLELFKTVYSSSNIQMTESQAYNYLRNKKNSFTVNASNQAGLTVIGTACLTFDTQPRSFFGVVGDASGNAYIVYDVGQTYTYVNDTVIEV